MGIFSHMATTIELQGKRFGDLKTLLVMKHQKEAQQIEAWRNYPRVKGFNLKNDQSCHCHWWK